MTRSVSCAIAALALPGVLSARQVLVLNRGDAEAAILELPSGRVAWRTTVGADPHELAMSPDGRFAFVGSYGGNMVYVIDTPQRFVHAQFPVEDYTRLHGMWVGRTEPVVWVTAETSRVVLELDAETGVVRNTWDTTQEMSHMVVGTPDDAKLYVANVGSGSVTVIDRKSETVKVVVTGAGAEGIDIAPNGREVWVSNNGANTVSVIEVAADQVITSFPSRGEFPVKLRFTPDGAQVWVSNNQSGTVAVFDVVTREPLRTIAVGPRPLGIGFSPDGRYGFVTVPGASELVQIAVADGTIVRRVATGQRPDGVAWVGAAVPPQ